MYLFTRSSSVDPGRALDAIAFATDVSAFVSENSPLEVHPWAAVYGNPGVLTWGALVESPAAMAAASEGLLANPGYLEKMGAAADLFTTAPEDNLTQIVATAGPANDGASRFVTITTAHCAASRFAEAMAWGVDTMNHVAEVTGVSQAFGRSVYGAVGTVGWMTSVDTVEELDAADAALMSDPTYIERMEQTADLFIAGSAHRILSRRLD